VDISALCVDTKSICEEGNMLGETKKVRATIIPREAEVFREANMAGEKVSDAPPNSLMDSTVNLKLKENELGHSPRLATL